MAEQRDVCIVGGGVAGLTAGVFTARNGLETTVFDGEGRSPSDSQAQRGDTGGSILRRNAHLENLPGFPAGVNARLFLDMLGDQADRAGCERIERAVTDARVAENGFEVETAGGERYWAEYVIAATKNKTDYLEGIDGVGIIDRGKAFVDADEKGRTGVNGLYAAGRMAEKPHQAIVCAGHGAEVAVALLEDDDRPFYHDWVAPEGYFTGRGIDVPPGCEEIDEAERERRERESLEVMREYFAEPYPDDPVQHPNVTEDDG